MVWKRIMNRHKKSKADTGKHLTCDLMEQYLRELTLDLNLKLLCERQTLDCGTAEADRVDASGLFCAERILWVDNIIVTAYEAAPDGRQVAQDSYSVESSHEPWHRRIRNFLQALWEIGQRTYP